MISLLLLAIISLLALIILFLIFRKRKIFLFFIAAVLGVAGWYGYKEYSRTNKHLDNVKADVKISAIELIKEYEKNDSIADTKYLGKVIETKGNVKAIEKDDNGYYTIVLADTGTLSSVRCLVDTVYRENAAQVVIGSSGIVRGACTGFNKDEMGLGSDVILNRCVIIQQKK
jgi:tRNA_anti-like